MVWAYLKEYSKGHAVSYKIRKEETNMEELLERILDNKNLYKAYEQVYRNKGTTVHRR